MSDDSDDDIDKLAKQEIAKLKRQYRHVEAERKYFCHKSENKLRKQKAVLKDLRVSFLTNVSKYISFRLIF